MTKPEYDALTKKLRRYDELSKAIEEEQKNLSKRAAMQPHTYIMDGFEFKLTQEMISKVIAETSKKLQSLIEERNAL